MTQGADELLPRALRTRRLSLRTLVPADSGTVLTLAGEWDVARMLADMPHPMTADTARQWTEAAAADRCLAIVLDSEVIGSVAVCFPEPGKLGGTGAGEIPGRPGVQAPELGFWLGRPWWGRGFAREAAGAVVDHVLDRGGQAAMGSGHFVDNPASGRVLSALGFKETLTTSQWCVARREKVPAIRYALLHPQARAAAGLQGSETGS